MSTPSSIIYDLVALMPTLCGLFLRHVDIDAHFRGWDL